MTFQVGQKVVCIDDRWTNPLLGIPLVLPKKGDVYIIRFMEFGTCGDSGKVQLGLRFHELVYPLTACGFEPSFAARCFRPVVSRKTDISSLEALLLPNAKILEGV